MSAPLTRTPGGPSHPGYRLHDATPQLACPCAGSCCAGAAGRHPRRPRTLLQTLLQRPPRWQRPRILRATLPAATARPAPLPVAGAPMPGTQGKWETAERPSRRASLARACDPSPLRVIPREPQALSSLALRPRRRRRSGCRRPHGYSRKRRVSLPQAPAWAGRSRADPSGVAGGTRLGSARPIPRRRATPAAQGGPASQRAGSPQTASIRTPQGLAAARKDHFLRDCVRRRSNAPALPRSGRKCAALAPVLLADTPCQSVHPMCARHPCRCRRLKPSSAREGSACSKCPSPFKRPVHPAAFLAPRRDDFPVTPAAQRGQGTKHGGARNAAPVAQIVFLPHL